LFLVIATTTEATTETTEITTQTSTEATTETTEITTLLSVFDLQLLQKIKNKKTKLLK
jgi:hypothetical protein